MLDTLSDMTPALIVLFITGAGVLLLAWWLSVKAEGKDEWLLGTDITERGTATVVARRDKDGIVHIVSSTFDPVVGEGRDEWLTGDDDAKLRHQS